MKGGFILHDDILKLFDRQPYREQDQNYLLMRNMHILHAILTMGGITITLLSNSSLYGCIFKIDIPSELSYNDHLAYEYIPGCDKGIHSHECYRPIKSYIIKLVFIGDHDTRIDGTDKNFNGRDKFIQECKTQYDLYNEKFLNGLYFIPPVFLEYPLFLREADILQNGYADSVLLMLNNVHNIESIINQLRPENDVGIIIMGFAEGYTTLFNAIDEINKKLNENRVFTKVDDIQKKILKERKNDLLLLGKFVHLLLFVEYKYFHGDPHLANIMVNLDYDSPHEWYNGKKKGRAILIDFGRSAQIPVEYDELIQNLINKRDITEVFATIHKRCLPEKFRMYEQYFWLFENVIHQDTDNYILFEMYKNYNTFQTTPPNDKYKEISVTEMVRKHIFGMNQLPQSHNISGHGGYNKLHHHKRNHRRKTHRRKTHRKKTHRKKTHRKKTHRHHRK